MSILESIKALTITELELMLFVPVGAIAPGVLAIWHFAPVFFDSVSTAKLLIAASSLCAPLVLANALLIFFWPFKQLEPAIEGDEAFMHAISLGAAFSAPLQLFVVIVSFIFETSVHYAAFLLLVVEAMFVAACLSLGRRRKQTRP